MIYNAWIKLKYKDRTVHKPFEVLAMSLKHAKKVIKDNLAIIHPKATYEIKELKIK